MAIITPYNHTAKLLWNSEVTLASLKLMLLNGATAFSAAHTTLTQVNNAGADEVSGGGWPSGGSVLASAAVTIVNTNGAMLDADNITVLATAGGIGPAVRAVIYETPTTPLFDLDFEGSKQSDEGIEFKISIPANGIARAAWAL